MSNHIRQLVTIITEAVLESELTRLLERLGARGYTITEARGKGSRGIRDAGWDEVRNLRLEVLCDEDVADAIMDHLQQHYYDNFAMVMFSCEVKVRRGDKF
jgi:nitrogen regulatory protein PII